MTLFPIEPAYFDFDPERGEPWDFTRTREADIKGWDIGTLAAYEATSANDAAKPSLWQRVRARLAEFADACMDPFCGTGVDD